MAKQTVGLGAAPNDGNGDTLRVGGDKINDNFDELYTALGNGSALSVATVATSGLATDINGTAHRLFYTNDTGDVVELAFGADGTVLTSTGLETAPAFEAVSGSGVSDGDKGDITVSAAGATWTIDNAAVTLAKMQDIDGLSVLGRSANTPGVAAPLVAANDGHVMRRNGSVINFGQIVGAGIADNVVTYGKIQDVSGASLLLGRGAGAGAGDPQEITLGTNLSMSGTTLNAAGGSADFSTVSALSGDWRGAGAETLIQATTALEAAASAGVSDGDKGDITVSGTGATWTIDNGVVTPAKIATQAGRTILANDTTGAASPTALVFGTNTALLRGSSSIVQSVSASRVLGRGSSGDAGLISAGTGLIFGPNDIRFASTAAQTILANATGSTAAPAALAVGTSTVVGRGPTGNIVGLTAGSGITISDTQISSTGGGALNNYAATVRPVVGDDTADGYSVGSKWIIVSGANAGEVWVCLDATAGAADWKQVAVGVAVSATKATPIDADEVPIFDSADGDATKVTTVGGIRGNQTIGTALGTTGTVNLDVTALSGTTQRIAASGTITFTTSNRVSGKFFKLRIAAGGASRTINYPAGWVPIGAALPTTIASGKVLRLDVECFGTADTDIDAVAVAQP